MNTWICVNTSKHKTRTKSMKRHECSSAVEFDFSNCHVYSLPRTARFLFTPKLGPWGWCAVRASLWDSVTAMPERERERVEVLLPLFRWRYWSDALSCSTLRGRTRLPQFLWPGVFWRCETEVDDWGDASTSKPQPQRDFFCLKGSCWASKFFVNSSLGGLDVMGGVKTANLSNT